MNRRDFVKRLLASASGMALAATVDVDKLLWVPGAKTYFLPSLRTYDQFTFEQIVALAAKTLDGRIDRYGLRLGPANFTPAPLATGDRWWEVKWKETDVAMAQQRRVDQMVMPAVEALATRLAEPDARQLSRLGMFDPASLRTPGADVAIARHGKVVLRGRQWRDPFTSSRYVALDIIAHGGRG